ncbi:MAG TPA: amidase [Phenylobacterium sp.]|uniref:amidase n=1 Tax=Phenylobacterium sp. TaxID=1871053 RepID=UPI002B49C596|nr:amidase [Phenylobacterium sp.]HKR89935.1 amidase [Phenylobacterium sp.]
MQDSAPILPISAGGSFSTATQWLEALRARRIGAVELLNLHLQQVEKHNGALNVVVAQDIEGALEAARRADNLPSSGRPPLSGLPMTVKDTYEVVGMPATCGFPFLADHRPQRDADPVARLKSAGAIIFGKTNVPAGAFDWQSFNPVYGTSKNPWDASRSPGGSSGGSAGALAAGFTPLELGSDMGGSGRVPAHFCGVFGHKPSYGVIPMRGHIPPLPGQIASFEMGVGSPLARSAQDLELALDLLIAPDERSQRAWSIAIPASRHERLQDFRVALWADDSAYALDDGYREAIHAYADDLRRLGVVVDEGARPDIDWQAAYEMYLTIILSIAGSGVEASEAREVIESAALLSPNDFSYPARMARALSLRHFEYYAVTERREKLFRAWRDFFTRYDLLICPTFATVAYEHDHRGAGAADPTRACKPRALNVSGQPRPYLDGLQWPSLANLGDLPSTAAPTGRFVGGLPAGVQLIGPYLEDRTPLRFAHLVERELGGFVPPPGCQ